MAKNCIGICVVGLLAFGFLKGWAYLGDRGIKREQDAIQRQTDLDIDRMRQDATLPQKAPQKAPTLASRLLGKWMAEVEFDGKKIKIEMAFYSDGKVEQWSSAVSEQRDSKYVVIDDNAIELITMVEERVFVPLTVTVGPTGSGAPKPAPPPPPAPKMVEQRERWTIKIEGDSLTIHAIGGEEYPTFRRAK